MSIEVTLTLSDGMIEQAKRFGTATKRDLSSVLTDTLELLWPTLGEIPNTNLLPALSQLSDAEVQALADSKMDVVQNQRLGMLQVKGKEAGLSSDERYELMALLHIYQLGQLRKAEALAELVYR